MKTLRKAGVVKRFHTVPTIGSQTVAEHSFGVAMLIIQICGGKPSVNLMKAALYHDLPEVFTGDIPATAKWRSKELCAALGQLENYFETVHMIHVELSDEERLILKWADMAELVEYSIEQVNMGNRYMLEVLARGVEYLEEMPPINGETELLLKRMQYELRRFYNEGA